MTREEKVKLLKDLVSGRIRIKDLRPKRLRIELGENGQYACFVDDNEVAFEEFDIQYKRQGSPTIEDTELDIYVEGISIKDPSYPYIRNKNQ